MNVFGAFTFGSLIKTFIPGFVWAIALTLLWRDLHAVFSAIVPAIPPLAGEEQTVLVLAIPAIILLGLLSNIVVFMGLNDRLVRNPLRRRDPGLFALHDSLVQQVRAKYWQSMGMPDDTLKAGFLRHADAELLILKAIGLSELVYVREQYWYHLEFQVNMLLGTACSLLALVASPSVTGSRLTGAILCRVVLEIIGFSALCSLLRRGALKNYHRHVGKMCTLMAIDLCQPAQPFAAAGPAQGSSP
jgi:hypothetical protein